MSPWVFVVLVVMAFGSGWTVNGWRINSNIEAAEKAQVIAQHKEAVRLINIADKASGGFELDRAKTSEKFVTITERVDHVIQNPIYLNVCFDADGLRELSNATSTTGTGLAGGPVPPVKPAK